jgi:hypothetical protein
MTTQEPLQLTAIDAKQDEDILELGSAGKRRERVALTIAESGNGWGHTFGLRLRRVSLPNENVVAQPTSP